jgi:hypothetical protein
MYGAMGWAHAALWRAGRRLSECSGQGTVEYVAQILLVRGTRWIGLRRVARAR